MRSRGADPLVSGSERTGESDGRSPVRPLIGRFLCGAAAGVGTNGFMRVALASETVSLRVRLVVADFERRVAAQMWCLTDERHTKS